MVQNLALQLRAHPVRLHALRLRVVRIRPPADSGARRRRHRRRHRLLPLVLLAAGNLLLQLREEPGELRREEPLGGLVLLPLELERRRLGSRRLPLPLPLVV
eukprot:822175-Prorocentrum_minimum.AAC.1